MVSDIQIDVKKKLAAYPKRKIGTGTKAGMTNNTFGNENLSISIQKTEKCLYKDNIVYVYIQFLLPSKFFDSTEILSEGLKKHKVYKEVETISASLENFIPAKFFAEEVVLNGKNVSVERGYIIIKKDFYQIKD